MNWIRTDIEIGHPVKSFELPYLQREHMRLGRKKFDISILQMFFEELQGKNKLKKGYIPDTAILVRVSMPPTKMSILFTCIDKSFPKIEPFQEIPLEEIQL